MAKNITFTPEQKLFIDTALESIEMNPSKRLNKPASDVLQRNNFVVDAHSHIFDGRCVEADYVVIRMLKLEDNPIGRKLAEFIVSRIIDKQTDQYERLSPKELLEAIYDEKKANQQFFTEHNLKPFESESEPESSGGLGIDWFGLLGRIKKILDILESGEMEYVYNYFEDVAINNYFKKKGKKKELLSIQLGMDLESGWRGSVLKDFQRQTDELLALSTKAPILPYLPVHPERVKVKKDRTGKPYQFNELYDTFLRCFKKGGPVYNGIKCYPSLGYRPSAMELAPIFEVCERAGIPIITHCGGEIISSFEKEIHTNEFGKPVVIAEKSRPENARNLNEPKHWKMVLEEFPQLHLSFGHFGGDDAWDQSKETPGERVQLIIDFMNTYDHVYADFSFNFKNKKTSRIFVDYLQSENPEYASIKKRAMFGTDFWVVVPMSDLEKDQKFFKKLTDGYHEALFTNNVVEFLGVRESIV